MEYNNIDNENFNEDNFYGMMPPDGAFAGSGFYLQKRPSSAGWVEGDEGFIQQTFLGASVVNFSISAGFSDTPNTLNVSLVADEFNKSDGSPMGSGDDIYHGGLTDCFSPPPIGSPVFFKFGKNFATVHQAYAKSYDLIYKFGLLPSGLSLEEIPEEPEEDTGQGTGEDTGEDTEEKQETLKLVSRKQMEGVAEGNAGSIDSETGEPCDPDEDADQENPDEESTCVKAELPEEARAIQDYHFLSSSGNQTPSLGYDENGQPTPNSKFVDKTKIYDPASLGLDPETLDKFEEPLITARGSGHLVFGGILDSFTKNQNANGNPVYSVSVSDPKEILSNCTLILNDYGKTTYNNKNLFNVYGFLEHELTDELREEIEKNSVRANYLTRFDNYNDSKTKEHNEFINLEDCYWMKERVKDPNLRSDYFSANPDFNEDEEESEENPKSISFVPDVGIRLLKFGASGVPQEEGEVQEDGTIDTTEENKDPAQEAKEEEEKSVLEASEVRYWFPITGFGMSRRSEKGMPLYRIIQSLPFMNYFMPQEGKDNGYGGSIDFRGYKFALNIDGLHDLFLDSSLIESIDVDAYNNKQCPAKTNADVLKDIYIDLDDITILELVQEIASAFNKDFVVELLPPIDEEILQPYDIKETDALYEVLEISKYNKGIIKNIQGEVQKTALNSEGEEIQLKGKEIKLEGKENKYKENDLIVGIIAITFIDKNRQPTFNELQNFLDANEFETAEVGYDLVNNVTDKFLVGAQKVDLYFFSSDRDRDNRLLISEKANPGTKKSKIEILEREQWTFRESLKQQILPYYGELADGVASIPVGFGPFQQILLNTESLNAFGVGDYYLATEIEIRAAMVSFNQWKEFLLKYNRRYVEGFFVDDTKEGSEDLLNKYAELTDEQKNQIKTSLKIDPDSQFSEDLENKLDNFRCGVSVPRSVIVSNENWYQIANDKSLEGLTKEEREEKAKENLESKLVSYKLNPSRNCFHPYGYPLYFGRAGSLGIFAPSDISRLSDRAESVQDLFADLPQEVKDLIQDGIESKAYPIANSEECIDYLLSYYKKERSDEFRLDPNQNNVRIKINDKYEKYETIIKELCSTAEGQFLLYNSSSANGNFVGFVNNFIRMNENNAKKIHSFIKSIGDEHLGKSFLVKLPQKTNVRYSQETLTNDLPPENGMVINSGSFGFPSIFQSGKLIPNSGGDLSPRLEAITNYDFLFSSQKPQKAEEGQEAEKSNLIEDPITMNPPFIYTDVDSSGNYIGKSQKVDGQTFIELIYAKEEEEPASPSDIPADQVTEDPATAGDTATEDTTTQDSSISSLSSYTGLDSIFDYNPRFGFDLISAELTAQEQSEDEQPAEGEQTGQVAQPAEGEESAGGGGGPIPYSGLLTDLEIKAQYTEGAFKARYNPTIDDWDFNYLPQSQGGYYDFELTPEKLRDEALYPVDATKLRQSNNRISAYAIYNNSQLIHFQGGDGNSIIQERIEKDAGDGVVNRRKRMDLETTLDNVGTNEPQFNKPINSYMDKSVSNLVSDYDFVSNEHIAFVKCSVEEKLLFAPRFATYRNIEISSSEFELVPHRPTSVNHTTEDQIKFDDDEEDVENPKNIGVLPTGTESIDAHFVNHVFAPKDPDGSLPKSNVESIEFVNTKYCDIYTELKDKSSNKTVGFKQQATEEEDSEEITKTKNLVLSSRVSMNSEHVYALVKLSTRPIPLFETRFVDGPQNSTNPVTVAKIWNRDTIKGGGPNNNFKNPPALTNGIEEEKIKFLTKTENQTDTTYVGESLPLANPEIKIDFIHPSPIHPNIVALPLLSKDRCYGPWTSTTTLTRNSKNLLECNETYANIGGKVEYLKDENLSPWKFDGYENMNKAGEIQVAFSNNLMLFTERATFTTPGIAKGVHIGRPLFNNSPIVDSISLDIDSDSVRTTVSLEVFSKKFGKTEKQRQEQLARLTREQKLNRQNKNRLIRSGSSAGLENVTELNRLFQGLSSTPNSSQEFTGLQQKNTVYDSVVASVVPEKIESIIYEASGNYPPGASGVIRRGTVTKVSNTASFQSKGYLQEIQSSYTDVNELNNALQRTGGSLLNDIYFPFDESVYNPYMTNIPYVDIGSITRRTS